MTETERLFLELVQISLRNRDSLSRNPSEKEWRGLFSMAQKHAVEGIAYVALEGLVSQGQKPPKDLLLEWIGLSEQIRVRNLQVNQRCKELEGILTYGGFKCCVLKGQGTALYYEKNCLYRQSGDIDAWVKGERDEVLEFAKRNGLNIGHVDIKHSDVDFFEDVPVEVHFMPSWMFSPIKNRRLQRFFAEQADRQFANKDTEAGFTHTTVEFDLVFSMVHIYRHIFSEGVGLRQLMDYYFILQHSTREQRDEAYRVLQSLRMSSFVGGVMWVLCECLGMKGDFMLRPANEDHGKYLLSEIMIAGNFGKYDDRMRKIDPEKRFIRGISQFKRNLRFVEYYPSEVLWSPFWKLWHWCWRKKRGYL